MRIGYFTTLLPYPDFVEDTEYYKKYPVGGSEYVAYHLALNIAKLGHDVHIFTTSVDSKSREYTYDNVTISRYGTNFRIGKAFFSYNLVFKPLKYEFDIVHLHTSTPPGDVAAWYYAITKRKPLIVTYHGDGVPNYGSIVRRIGTYFYIKAGMPRILANAKAIISPSAPYIKQSKLLPRYTDKTIAIPNGIDPDELKIPFTKAECREKLLLSIHDNIILFVGYLNNYKSPNLLIDALPLVNIEVPYAKIILVGDGPMRHELEQLAIKLGVSDKVRFAGPAVGKLKALYYGAADVFVFPSAMNTDVFPIVLLEASAAGLPIVVSSLPTLQCIIEDNYNGLIARAGDTSALASAIIKILMDQALQLRIGANARHKIKDYCWEAIAKATEQVYLKISEVYKNS